MVGFLQKALSDLHFVACPDLELCQIYFALNCQSPVDQDSRLSLYLAPEKSDLEAHLSLEVP